MFKIVKNEEITNNEEINNVKIYESECYSLRILSYNSGYKIISISKINNEKNEYIPSVYINQSFIDGCIDEIEIQTTSYGARGISGIEKIILGYQVAIESVKEIKEILIQEKLLSKDYKEE